MNPFNKHPKLDSSFQPVHANRPERQADGTPGIGTLRLVNFLKSAVDLGIGWISRWHQRRTLIRKLQALNDHYLKDIGLERSDITSYIEEIIVMDAESKYKTDRYNPNKYLIRNGTHGIQGESISSTEEKQG